MAVKPYKDPMLNMHDAQTQTVGAWKKMKGKMPMPKKPKMTMSANPSRWSSKGR